MIKDLWIPNRDTKSTFQVSIAGLEDSKIN